MSASLALCKFQLKDLAATKARLEVKVVPYSHDDEELKRERLTYKHADQVLQFFRDLDYYHSQLKELFESLEHLNRELNARTASRRVRAFSAVETGGVRATSERSYRPFA